MALRPLFPFQQAQYVEVCTILHALCRFWQHQQAFHFSSLLLLSDSRSVLTTLFSLHLSIYLNLISRNCLLCSPVLSGYNGSPDTRFSWETMRLMSWPGGERYLHPLQSLVVSLLLSLLSTLLFSRTVGLLSHRNSLIHRFPHFSLRSLCSLVTRAVLSRLHCNGRSLLLSSYLFRIGRIENPSCSACEHSSQNISHFILHCPATHSLRRSLSVSLRPLVQALRSCPASGAPWSSSMPTSLGKGWVTTKTTRGT